MTTTVVPKQQKKLSPAGCTSTPNAPASYREIDALSSELCEQAERLQGLCRTLGVLAWAENIEGLSLKDIGKTALLMEQALGGVHEGLVKIEGLAVHPRQQAAA